MVKARSIDISLKPKEAYEQVYTELEDNGLKIKKSVDLKSYEKDHMTFVVTI